MLVLHDEAKGGCSRLKPGISRPHIFSWATLFFVWGGLACAGGVRGLSVNEETTDTRNVANETGPGSEATRACAEYLREIRYPK